MNRARWILKRLSQYCVYVAAVTFAVVSPKNSLAQGESDTFEIPPLVAERLSQNHSKLFGSFANDRPTVFSADGVVLREVGLHFNAARPQRTYELTIPQEDGCCISFFDTLVLRGVDLPRGVFAYLNIGEIEERLNCTTLNSSEIDGNTEHKYSFPWQSLFKKIDFSAPVKIRFKSNEPLVISSVSLASSDGVPRKHSDFQASVEKQFNRLVAEYEGIARRLGIHADRKKLPVVPALFSAGPEIIEIYAVFGDKRVPELCNILNQLDKTTASAIVRKQFDLEFVDYQDRYNASSLLSIREQNGMKIHLFLCALFCTNKEFVGKLNQWYQWHDDSLESNNNYQFLVQAGPDFMMVCNLLAMKVAANRNMSPRESVLWTRTFFEEELKPRSPITVRNSGSFGTEFDTGFPMFVLCNGYSLPRARDGQRDVIEILIKELDPNPK